MPSLDRPGRRGQCDKTSPAWEDPSIAPMRRILLGQRFALSCKWPRLGGGQSLIPDKDNVKVIIKWHGGSVTSGFLRLTKVLVIGDSPGLKKILEAHEQSLSIVDLAQITSIITNDGKAAQDLLLAPYPETAMAIPSQHNIQMKRPPPSLDPSEHCRTADSSTDKEVQGQDGGTGVGHGNE
jgi:hypothetical protein